MGLGVILWCRCGGCPCRRGCFLGNLGLTAEYGGVYLSRYLVDFGDDAAQILALIRCCCPEQLNCQTGCNPHLSGRRLCAPRTRSQDPDFPLL